MSIRPQEMLCQPCYTYIEKMKNPPTCSKRLLQWYIHTKWSWTLQTHVYNVSHKTIATFARDRVLGSSDKTFNAHLFPICTHKRCRCSFKAGGESKCISKVWLTRMWHILHCTVASTWRAETLGYSTHISERTFCCSEKFARAKQMNPWWRVGTRFQVHELRNLFAARIHGYRQHCSGFLFG